MLHRCGITRQLGICNPHGPHTCKHAQESSRSYSIRLHCHQELVEGRQRMRALQRMLCVIASMLTAFKAEHAASPQPPERLAQLQNHERAFGCGM